MSIIQNIKTNGMYWLFGLEFIIFGIVIMILSYDTKLIAELQKNLTYDKITYMLGLVILCLGIMYLSRPISEIIARNKTFQKWVIKYTKKGDIKQ